ncbi:unnamed protein product [Clavelina lepadiformis]|uniref:BHLH domain-containing protein n=1 Tax=Clavelina lepadiformis TaxID=159417 RepID=A0ABP0H1J7_CLALP
MVKASPLHENMSLSNDRSAKQAKKLDCIGKVDKRNQICFKEASKLQKRQELRLLYKKLREVIPSCKAKPVSSLDIVLHAVDYINDLHKMLDNQHPGAYSGSFPLQFDNNGLVCQPAVNKNSQISFRDVTNVNTLSETRPHPKLPN